MRYQKGLVEVSWRSVTVAVLRTWNSDLPDEFVEFVRDALLHLYDLAYLQTHPLLSVMGSAETGALARGKRLRQSLLDAIEAVQPDPTVAAPPHAWRTYRLLELRYIEGLEVAEVIEQISLSKSQYHREHHRALLAVASLLWERWDGPTVWDRQPVHRPSETAVQGQNMGPILNAPPTSSQLLGHGWFIPERTTGSDVEQFLTEVGTASSTVLDLNDILRGVQVILQALCARQHVDLRLRLPPQPPLISGSREACRQVFLIILAYAIELAEHGTVSVTVSQEPTGAVVDVLRTGTVAPARESQIARWQPLVRMIGSSISLLAPADIQVPWAVRLGFSAARRATLLVVDNSADFVNLIRRYVAGTAWDAAGVATVDEALAYARQHRPDAILLDIVIPGRDGWDLLLELSRSPGTRDIPAIVCSVLSEPSVASSLGAVAYLHKPISQEALLRVLSSLPSAPALSR